MKELKDYLKQEFPLYYEFKIFISDNDGARKTVGVGTLKEGQDMYHLKLWSFLNEKFYLVPNRKDPKNFYIMTREPLKKQSSQRKFSWNIVGSAKANVTQDLIELSFDLFERKVFLNIVPEQSQNPTIINTAA